MKKIFVLSTIMAVLVASLSAFSVFAAPVSTSQSEAVERIFGPQLKELQADRNFYDHFKADRNNFVSASDPIKLQRYLADYAAALAKADSIIASRGTAVVTSKTSNAQATIINNMGQSAQTDLATVLHELRSLKVTLTQIG